MQHQSLIDIKNGDSIHQVVWAYKLTSSEKIEDDTIQKIETRLHALLDQLILEKRATLTAEYVQSLFDGVVSSIEKLLNQSPLDESWIYEYGGLNCFFSSIMQSFDFHAIKDKNHSTNNFVYGKYFEEKICTTRLELVPVIEIFESNDSISSPQTGPYWEYPEEFASYHKKLLLANGYDEMEEYVKGSALYEIDKLTDKNLLLEIKKWTTDWDMDDICPFDGGYILKIDGQNMLFPQCCGDLSDIEYWKNLSDGETCLFWQGHPQPLISLNKGMITINLSAQESYEAFVPTPEVLTFDILLSDLQLAIKEVLPKLDRFAKRIDELSTSHNLNIPNLGKLLVWGNQ